MSFVVTVRAEFPDKDSALALVDQLTKALGSDGEVHVQEYKFPTEDDLAGIPNPDSPPTIDMQLAGEGDESDG